MRSHSSSVIHSFNDSLGNWNLSTELTLECSGRYLAVGNHPDQLCCDGYIGEACISPGASHQLAWPHLLFQPLLHGPVPAGFHQLCADATWQCLESEACKCGRFTPWDLSWPKQNAAPSSVYLCPKTSTWALHFILTWKSIHSPKQQKQTFLWSQP